MTASAGKPNIGTVAAKAKVAPMTVSRVLNGGYASAAVRARVERAIEELGYVPSATARSAKRPSAVVLDNDSLAIAFMRELLRAGVSVPDEVSVTGFDGIDEGERAFPALTTVAQPMHCLGAAASGNVTT